MIYNMGIKSSKDVLVLPNGVDKIIEEYCIYARRFEKELLKVTNHIHNDCTRGFFNI